MFRTIRGSVPADNGLARVLGGWTMRSRRSVVQEERVSLVGLEEGRCPRREHTSDVIGLGGPEVTVVDRTPEVRGSPIVVVRTGRNGEPAVPAWWDVA